MSHNRSTPAFSGLAGFLLTGIVACASMEPRRLLAASQAAALVQHPGQPQFLAVLGEVERQRKNPRRSVELTRQALQVDESFAQSRYYLGLALLDLGQRDEAIRELERVVLSPAGSPQTATRPTRGGR